ncbi:hypothetical protein ACJVDH_08580 [Pedobacter sp. AW1-32]|uniref:hypothetical protein n=1 Tax=Pedobacter sp. AW1-32 TaxID=3383026 RepID=UPI003FF0898F
MKNSKTAAESSKATSPGNAKAKGANDKTVSAKDAQKVSVTKDAPEKHTKP